MFENKHFYFWIGLPVQVVERNPDDNYLSAGEMPLPALYFMMALLFLLSAAFWFFLLKKSKWVFLLPITEIITVYLTPFFYWIYT